MGAAAAIILSRERRLVETFEQAGVTSPESARAPDQLNVDTQGLGWRRLRERAVVREAGPGSGRYYLDVEVWEAVSRQRKRMMIVMLVLVAVIVGLGIFLPRQL
jgi:hypothetical protein